MSPRFLVAPWWLVLALVSPARAQIAVTPSYTQDFNAIGTALPAGWGLWTASGATGNGTAFTWDPAATANNATATTTSYFRNVPGASQSWTTSLAAGADRALGWRAGSATSRDGSITFTLTNTTGWSLTSLSLQLFTPNSSGSIGTYQLQYQLGATGTFTNFSPAVTYTNDTAQAPLVVTSISLTSAQLAPLANQSGQVTLRLDNTGGSGTSWNTVAIDNFSYTASAIPEPALTTGLCAGAALGIAWWRRRAAKRAASPSQVPSQARRSSIA